MNGNQKLPLWSKLENNLLYVTKYHLGLVLLLLIVACEQQPPSDSQVQPTLVPLAIIPTEIGDSGSMGVNTTATFTPPTSTATGVNVTESTPTVQAVIPSPVPVTQGTPAPVTTLPPSTTLVDDGSWVLFLERDDEYAPVTLYAVKPDGSNLVVLAETFDNGAHLLDSTSDGQWVLMTSQMKGTYLLKLDGSQEQISLDSRPAYNGTWSPDGQRILLVFQDGVVVADAATGQGVALPLPLTFIFSDPNASPQPGFVEGASWSPDGSWVVAQQVGLSEEGQLVRGLYRYTTATATLTTIWQNNASGMASSPLVSPDGQTVLTSSPTTNSGLISWPVDGGDPKSLVEMALPLIEPPQWSPDGTWLALIYADDVVLLRADGAVSRQLTFTAELVERQLAWSPDGQGLTGVAYQGDRSPQLFRLDVVTGAITWLAVQNPALRGLGHHNPQWLVGSGTGASPWPAAAAVPPLPDPGAPTPPADLVLNPPPMSIDPPWWGHVFFYRRQISLPEALPLPTSPFALPVLAQVSFPTSLIWEQLAFGEYQHDLRLAWWGGPAVGWRELGYGATGLEGETLTLIFPLQAGPNGETGDYYLYYGAPGRLASSPPDLYDLYLPSDPQDENASSVGYGLEISPLADPEEIETISGVVNWPLGWQNRPVLELTQPESQATGRWYFSSAVQAGTFQMWLRPQTNNPTGIILAADTELPGDSPAPGETLPPPTQQPFLTYDGQAFHLTLAGQTLVAPYALPADTWQQVVATWQSEGEMHLYLNGQLIGVAPYVAPVVQGWDDMPMPFFRTMSLGAAAGQPGIPGQYANMFIFDQPLHEAEIQLLHQGQTNVQATIAPQAEMAVTQATIGPEGGWLRSPDGQGWVEFTPGAVMEATTVYWVAYNPSGDTRPDHLQRYLLVTGDAWLAYAENIRTLEELSTVPLDQPFQAPIHVYHQYDPVQEIAPWTIVVFRWDEGLQEWLAHPTLIDTQNNMALSLEVEHSGSFTVADNYGLGFPPSVQR